MITVYGAGAFGTALAISLAQSGCVTLWARDADHAGDMAKTRVNSRRLQGITLPEVITITATLRQHAPGDICLLAIPAQKLRDFLHHNANALANCTLVACCKGIEQDTGFGPTQIIADLIPSATPAMLTGPSFAADIARSLPTALTLACADEAKGKALQQVLTTPNLRIYRTSDTIGAELGGALKNVMAIACGAAIGAGLGESARAALITRGFAEMSRMAVHLGAAPETLHGLSGFGDLILTCTSGQSRNYRFGLSLGRDRAFDAGITVEGVATARAVLAKSKDMKFDMPVTAAVVALIDHKLRVGEALDMLLSRPLKEE